MKVLVRTHVYIHTVHSEAVIICLSWSKQCGMWQNGQNGQNSEREQLVLHPLY